MLPALLDVQRLTTVFEAPAGRMVAVDDVSFTLGAGETLGLVGESGSGKTVTALSLLRLVQPPGRIAAGRVGFEGRDLMTLPEEDLRAVRGARIGLVFQDASGALNPVLTVGDQIAETLAVHGLARGKAARTRAIELLDAVRIHDPARRADDYPHQLSGGMRQRVSIAMAIACRPALVVADEPTASLDTTVQAEILALLGEMRQAFGVSLLLITHDLRVVAGMADRVAVMQAGRIVEQGPVAQVIAHPSHPYTRSLIAAGR